MKKLSFLLTIVLVSSMLAYAGDPVNLMPAPQKVVLTGGQFKIDTDFSIAINGQPAEFVFYRADDFLRRLAGRTGLFITQERIRPDRTNPENPLLTVHVDKPGELEMGTDESYSIKISENKILLTASTSFGALHGLETLLQLLSNNQDLLSRK